MKSSINYDVVQTFTSAGSSLTAQQIMKILTVFVDSLISETNDFYLKFLLGLIFPYRLSILMNYFNFHYLHLKGHE